MSESIAKISGFQLTSILLASRLSGCLLFTFDNTPVFSWQGVMLSVAVSGIFLCVFVFPSLLVLHRNDRCFWAVTEGRKRLIDKGINGFFLIACVFIMTLDIVQFSDYASRTMRSDFSVLMLTVVLIVAGFFASGYGIQAIARSSTVVAVFVIVCLLIFTGALLPEFRIIHFAPNTESNPVFKKALLDLPRTAEILAIGWLYPHVTKKQARSTFWFVGIITVISALVGLTTIGILGDFSGMTPYPYYTAVSAAKAGILQRFDIVITTVWLGTFFMRFALFSFLVRTASKRVFGKRTVVVVSALVCLLLSVVAYAIQQGNYNSEWKIATYVYWFVLLGVAFVLPTSVWLIQRRKRR